MRDAHRRTALAVACQRLRDARAVPTWSFNRLLLFQGLQRSNEYSIARQPITAGFYCHFSPAVSSIPS